MDPRMEAAHASKILFYKLTWCHIPEDLNLHQQHSENLRSHVGAANQEVPRLYWNFNMLDHVHKNMSLVPFLC